MLLNSEGALKKSVLPILRKINYPMYHFWIKLIHGISMHLIYKKSDILILPSLYSNGNGSIIEAGASGDGIRN